MKLNLLADVSNFSTGINTADHEAKGLSGKMEKYGKRMAAAFAVAAAAAGAMAVKIGLESVKAASDLNEEINKTEVVFGDTAKEIKDFAKTADRALGLTNKSALQAASTFAILGKNAGLTGTELSKFSKDSTKIAADLGSFFNTSTEDAVLAIGSALRGEAEPIRRYGVLISAASLEQAAFNFETRTGTELARDAKNQLTEQSKVLARYQAILDQTTDAQGDFGRTSDGLANSQKILAAQLENLKATMGTSLLPVAKEVITQLNFMAAAFGGKDPEGLSERARELAGAYDGQGGGAYNLVLAIKNVGDSFSRMFDSMSGPNATEAGTALQNIANAINGIANAFDKLGTAYGKVKPVLDKFPASIIRNRFWDFVFSSAQSDVSRAAGGPVMANQVARVGEFGPELFVPNGVSGSIRKDNGAGSGNTFIFNGVIDGESARRSIEKLLQDSARRTGAVNFVGATL
jgi:SLT domain-containing protein